MANILCIETATTNCSVALSVNGSVIALREDNTLGYSHAEKLHVFIEEVLFEAKIKKDALDAVSVSKGPGSYTGLRIGVSAAKGLCYSLDVPLLAVETLETLAHRVEEECEIVIPILDARRMEVYSAVFSSEILVERETRAEVLDENSFGDYLKKGKVAFIGSGVDKFEEICDHPNAIFIKNELPSATNLAAISEEKFKANQFEDVAYFEPYYLKDFIAGGKPK